MSVLPPAFSPGVLEGGQARSQGKPPWPQWLIPLFLGAHVVVTAILIPLLRVRDSRYRTIPWIFGVAFAVSLIPPLRRRLAEGHPLWRASIVALYLGVITLASSVHPSAITGDYGIVFHPVEFAGLAFVGLLALHRGPLHPLRPLILGLVVLGSALLGALDEIHQSFVPRRIATSKDVLWDTIGGVLGTAIFVVMVWLYRWRERTKCGPGEGDCVGKKT